VPEPRIVPARALRVFVMCASRRGKSKVMSTPASGLPKGAPLISTVSGRLILPPSHASPNSSGVTATGENAVEGFDW
jgi:hypothetical protein